MSGSGLLVASVTTSIGTSFLLRRSGRWQGDGEQCAYWLVMSNTLWPHGLLMWGFQVSDLSWSCLSSCPLNQWCHPNISSSVTPFSVCLQPFPVSGCFSRNQLFTLKITLLAWEMTAIVWWSEHCLALPFLGIGEDWPFPLLWLLLGFPNLLT